MAMGTVVVVVVVVVVGQTDRRISHSDKVHPATTLHSATDVKMLHVTLQPAKRVDGGAVVVGGGRVEGAGVVPD